MRTARASALAVGLLLGPAYGVRTPLAAQAAPAAARVAAADSLTAQQFGALVARLSEPGGQFDTDNLISNESSYLHPLTVLDRLGVRGGGYIGVGPDQNFSYMARVRPSIAFIVDIRRDNLLHHLLLKALFDLSRSRSQYLAYWLGKPVPPATRDVSADLAALVRWAESTPATSGSSDAAVRAVRGAVTRYGVPLSDADLATIERFHRTFIADGLALRFTSTGRAPREYYPTLGQLITERDLAGRQSSYLATDASFQFLRGLQRRNLVIPVVGDLSGPTALAAIGAELRARGERVSVLYTSNVEDYLIRGGRFASYAATVSRLPRDARSVIVRSWFGGPMTHPAWVEGHHATQLVQTMNAFATDPELATMRSYRQLVQRFVPMR